MRAITLVTVSLALVALSGCAAKPVVEPKAPEPVTLSSADFTPHDEFEMNLDTKQGPAVKRSAPNETTIAPRLVSRER